MQDDIQTTFSKAAHCSQLRQKQYQNTLENLPLQHWGVQRYYDKEAVSKAIYWPT